jgi:hypothetical protein
MGVAKAPDFSVVLFRSNFMLVSEEYLMKVHKNQWLLYPLSPPDIPRGATNQGTPHGARTFRTPLEPLDSILVIF